MTNHYSVDMTRDNEQRPSPWAGKNTTESVYVRVSKCSRPCWMKDWHTICEMHRDCALKEDHQEVDSFETTIYFSDYLLLSSVVFQVKLFDSTFMMNTYIPYFASQLKYASAHFKQMNSQDIFQSTMKKVVLDHAALKEAKLACHKHKHVVTTGTAPPEARVRAYVGPKRVPAANTAVDAKNVL